MSPALSAAWLAAQLPVSPRGVVPCRGYLPVHLFGTRAEFFVLVETCSGVSRAATRNAERRGRDGEKKARGRCFFFFFFDGKRKCCLDVVAMATSVSCCKMSAGETQERKNKFQIKWIH